jgi:3-phenylpropionate/trans-cinnamate dioxygenase ferredoxin reductase component
MDNQRVVIVGAGLGGLRAAEALRANGFAGEIDIVGDEEHIPYNRPPLSKEALKSGLGHEDLKFRQRDSIADVHWRLGSGARSLNLEKRTLTLDNGEELIFDGLVIATGIRPRLLPIPGPTQGLFTLRTLSDAQKLREAIVPGENLVILGSGFIGCELAATGTLLGANVHVVSLDSEPMVMPMGLELGGAMRRRHEAKGVTFHLGRTVSSFNGDEKIESVTLDNGDVIPTGVVVEAIGSVPNVEWLEGNDLDLSNGVLVDHTMRLVGPVGTEGTDVPVVAVGDIARHPSVLYADGPRRIEHWNMPTETGKRAGATLAALLRGDAPTDEPFAALPAFWSDQFEYQLQSYGLPGAAASSKVVSGGLDGPCIVEYFNDKGHVVGVIGIDTVKELVPYRKQLMNTDSTNS